MNFEEKKFILRRKFFLFSFKIDLIDIDVTIYSLLVSMTAAIIRKKIKKTICWLAVNKVSDISQILNRVLRVKIKKILTFTYHLFNICLKLKYYFKLFKRINIIVLHKFNKKDYTDSKIYHLIVLFNTLKKTLKSVMTTRINNLTKQHHFFSVTQIKN